MSESTPSVKPDETNPDTSTSASASTSSSNIEWTPIDNQTVITAVSIDESRNPTNDDTTPNQGDNTVTVKPESVPNKLSVGYMSLYPLLCVVMNLAFVVMMMLDIRAFQRYNALCVGVWVFTIISVVYALAIGWTAINDDIKTRRNNTTDKTGKQDNNPVETNADHHTANTATQNDTIIQNATQANADTPVSDVVRVEIAEKTIEEDVANNTDNVYGDNNNQPSNDKYPKGASKYDEPLIVDADNLAFDKTLDNKQVLHPANKTLFEPVEPTKETADNLSSPQKDTSDTPDPKIMKIPHVPAVPAVIIKKHDEPMTQHVPNTTSVYDDTDDTGDSNNKHDDDTKTNQPQPASADTSDNTDDATTDAHDDADADADVITRAESDPDIIAVEQRIINQTEPPQGTLLDEVRKEIRDALAAKTENHTTTASNDENDDADDSDKQTPSVPDGSTYTFDVD